MNEKENLLALIEKTDELIAEAETLEEYGIGWKARDYNTRRSIAAGELCQIIQNIAAAETIAETYPRSIIAREARNEARAARRKQAELERIIAEPIEEYEAKKPRFPIHKPAREYQQTEGYIHIYRGHHWPLYLMSDGTTPTSGTD